MGESDAPDFEIIVLVGTLPPDYGTSDESALKSYKARMMTYALLIKHAEASYRDFLERQKKIDRIQKMVDSL
jgi:hypothetical protein